MNARASHMSDVPAIPQRPAILIVEDELILAKDLQRTLIDFGYDAFAIATSAKSALRCARERCPDLVLMDIRIKGPKDGIETAGLLTKQFSTALIYLTAHADTAMIKRAKETEPHGYLLKPINTVELHTAVEIALHKHRLEQARAAVNESNELFRQGLRHLHARSRRQGCQLEHRGRTTQGLLPRRNCRPTFLKILHGRRHCRS